MSFAGRGGCPSYLQSSVNHAVGLGALLISAAGNQGLNTTDYFPANCRGVMAIAATNREGRLAGYSNYGLNIDLSAPGGDGIDPIPMLTLDDTGNSLLKDFGMGTSFAVPEVVGVAALMAALQHGKVSREQILGSTQQFANDSVQCSAGDCGKGIIQALALREVFMNGNASFVTMVIGNQRLQSSGPDSFVVASGTGLKQVPGNGTYCQTFYPGSFIEVDAGFGACLTGPGNCNNPSCVNPCQYIPGSWFSMIVYNYCCPWTTNLGCSYGKYYDDSDAYINSLSCDAGCVSLGNCINLPDNAVFTGPGTIATDCPWKCKKYYNSTGSTCLPTCATGYYYPTGSTVCTPCTFKTQALCANDQVLQACTVTSDAQCVPCANKIDNANPTPVCVWTCFLGSYFKNSSGLCQACKASLTCPTGSFTLGCDTVTDESCSPCTNLPASNAYYTTNGGLGTLQSPGPCNWACNAGYFQATSQDTGCTTCPAGSISAAGSTACTPCPAGTYAATASLCLSCPSGMYASTAGSTACLSCTWCTAQGMYKQCGGSSAGTCSTCSN